MIDSAWFHGIYAERGERVKKAGEKSGRFCSALPQRAKHSPSSSTVRRPSFSASLLRPGLGNTLTFFHQKCTQPEAMFRAFYFVASLAFACQVRESMTRNKRGFFLFFG
jgi:hypothetical protein